MKFGKRRKGTDAPDPPDATVPSAESAPPPATGSWTAPPPSYEPEPEPAPLGYTEPVVEGEAVELPPVEPAAPAYEPPIPVTVQAHTAPPAEPPPYANGHGAAAAAAPGPSWQEPLMELADERPEVVVGAAFAGGVLAALILRRLGN